MLLVFEGNPAPSRPCQLSFFCLLGALEQRWQGENRR